MKKLYQVIIFLLSLTIANNVFGSHVPGGNITYTCVGPNQYFVKLTLFEDCATGFGLGSSVVITAKCNGTNLNFTLNRSAGPTEVSQLCPSQMSSSSCNGGTLPGVEMSVFSGTITLPFACDSWALGYGLCCRNTSTNVASQPSIYIETKLNNLDDACNNSPYVTAQPIPYVCLNQPVNYNLGVVDSEGDSLSFALVEALDGPNMTVTYNAGYSGAQPIPGTTINSQTGQLNFTPNTTGSFIFAIKIFEYDSAGNILSSIIHDFRFEVISCINQIPAAPSSGMSSFTGTAKKTGPNTIEGCPGDNFCFSLSFNDINILDTLSITSNVTSVLPGSTLTFTSSPNPKTATVCYTIPATASGVYPFTFTAKDNACPVYGQATMAITLKVFEGISAGGDKYICSGQSAQLTASGGTSFTWSVISGPAMAVGTNISCNNCQNPVVTPTATTVYKVVGNLSANCINTDTVTVFVEPNFPLSITPATSTVCQNQAVQLTAVANNAPGYSYLWSPATGLSGTTLPNPIATPMVTTTYTVNVESAGGCVKTATAIVNVNGIGPTVDITGDTTICLGQSVPLNSSISLQPGACGPNTTPCSGNTAVATVGTGTLNTDYGGPFYSHVTLGHTHPLRHQYIYTAAELQAAGYTTGVTITSIAVEISTANASVFQSFRMQMGCTSVNSFVDGTYLSGLTPVYSNAFQSIPASPGWYTITLQTPYDWDGVSNLVVEFCSAGSPTNGARVNYTSSSPYYRAIYDHEETGGCTVISGTRSYMRINMKFTACQRVIGTPTYSWTPVTGLSNPSIPNPIATPTTSTTYMLNVTDGATGCIGSAAVYIGVGPNYTLSTSSDPSICYGNSAQLQTTPSVAGTYSYNWSPSFGLSYDSIANPQASPGISTAYHVEVSNGNCIRRDTVQVNVFGIPVTATASNDTVCPGTQVQLDVTSYPSSCGLNPVGCSGSTSFKSVGNGTFSSTTYSPFYGVYEDSRIQFLYLANDLLNSGVTPGTITSLAFNVLTKASSAPFSGFTVKMGCTSSANLQTTAWEATSGIVYGPVSYSTVLGWNNLLLSTPFNWDGVSNLVIEICFDNTITVGGDQVEYTSAVGYFATLKSYQNMASGCSLSPSYRYSAYPNLRIGICNNSLPTNATYLWTPSAGLSNPNIPNPIATVNYDVTYTVNIADPSLPGCNSIASVALAVDPTNRVEVSSDVNICPGDSTSLTSTFFGPPPVSSIPCGTNNTNCTGPVLTYGIGAGTSSNSSYSYPAVYGNYYWGAKHQIIYRASELLALGMQSGTISELGFNVSAINGTATYNNVTIKMGCTSQSVLTNWVSGLQTVFTSPSITINTGWNMHTLSNTFDWDGVSNIIVEFCFNNNSYISNISTFYTNTNYNSVIYYRADNSNVCSTAGYVSASMSRPNTRFKICNAPPASLTYNWNPAATLSDSTIPNPIAEPSVTTTYVLTVTGTKCDLTDTVVVGVTLPDATFSYADPFCKNGPNPLPIIAANASAGTFSATPSGLSFLSASTGEINLAGSSPGTYIVTNTVTGTPGCPGDVATDTVVIKAVPSVNVANITSCHGSAVTVPAFVSTPAGATFTWTNDNPSIGLAASGTGNIVSFTATNTNTIPAVANIAVTPMLNGCAGTPASFTVTVNPAPTVAVTSTTHCPGAPVPSAVFTSTPAGATYTWTNSNTAIGLIASGSGDVPAFTATNAGSSPLSGTIAVIPSLNGCTGSVANYTITVNPPDNAAFNYSTATFCQTGTNPVPVVSGVPGGLFTSGPGIALIDSTGEIDLASSSLGQYVITYSTNGTCPNNSTLQVSITDAPMADFFYNDPFCNNGTGALPSFLAGASAGVFSSSPSGLVFQNTSTGEINLASSAPGSYLVTNTIAASGGCAAAAHSDSVVIRPVPTVQVSNVVICAGANVPATSFNSNPPGASFTWTNSNPSIGLGSNGVNNIPSFTATNSGTTAISGNIAVTATLNNCSSAPASYSITVNSQDNASFAYASSGYCKTSANPAPTLSGTVGGAFTASGTIIVDPATGVIDLAQSQQGSYQVVYTTTGACPDTSSFALSIDQPDVSSFDFAGPYCQDASDPSPVFISGGTAGTFSFTPAGLSIDPSTGIVDLSASASGLYTITNTVTSPGACPSSVWQDTLRIRPVPVSSYVSIAKCAGTVVNPAAFSSTPSGAVFNWTNDAPSIGLAGSGTGDLPSFTIMNSGSSAVIANILATPVLNGCAGSSASFTITANPADNAAISYSSTVYCQSGTDPLPIVPGTQGGVFASSGGLVIDPSSGEIDLSASTVGNYTISYITNGTCADSGYATLSVNSTSEATFSLGTEYCKGSGINPVPSFAAGASAGTFTASPAGLVFANSSTGEIDLAASAGGTYNLTNYIPAAGGCLADTHSVSVRIDEMPVAFAGTDIQLCSGASGNLGATGNSAFTYNWDPSTGINDATISNPVVSMVNTSNSNLTNIYTLVTVNGTCSDTDQVVVTVARELTSSAGVIQQPSCASSCNAQIGVIASGGYSANYTYSWSNGSTSAFNGSVCAGNYSVTIKDDLGCEVLSNTITVTDPTPLSSSVSSMPAYCNQSNGSAIVDVAGGTGAYTYTWTSAAQTDSVANALSPGTYIVQYSDQNQCQGADTVVVGNIPGPQLTVTTKVPVKCNGDSNGSLTVAIDGGTAPYIAAWDGGQNTLSISGLSVGQYCVEVTDSAGCSFTLCDSIPEPAPMSVAVSGDTTICKQTSAQLAASGSGGNTGSYTYTWSPASGLNTTTGSQVNASPNASTTYTVVCKDSKGCTASPAYVSVALNNALQLMASADTAVCPGSAVTLSASASGGSNGPYTYSWAAHPTLSGNSGSTVIATPSTTMNYYLTVSDNCSMQPVRDTIRVVVHNVAPVQFTPQESTGCYPFSVQFENTTTNAVSSTWTFGDGSPQESGPTASHLYEEPGSYSVTLHVVDNNGCERATTRPNLVYVSDHPVADFSASSDSVSFLEPAVQFTDLSLGASVWEWVFAGADSLSSQHPLYVFPAQDSGTYSVQLRVMNQYGCADSITRFIRVYSEGTLYIPNAFSPNGDGLNDVFIPVGTNIAFDNYSLQIYDRWGTMIFETKDPTKGWDGRVSGGSDVAPQEVYVYKIIAVDSETSNRFPVSTGRVSIIH